MLRSPPTAVTSPATEVPLAVQIQNFRGAVALLRLTIRRCKLPDYSADLTAENASFPKVIGCAYNCRVLDVRWHVVRTAQVPTCVFVKLTPRSVCASRAMALAKSCKMAIGSCCSPNLLSSHFGNR